VCAFDATGFASHVAHPSFQYQKIIKKSALLSTDLRTAH
jgi:hypothetical protein